MNPGRESSSASVREQAARWFAIAHRRVMTLDERAAYEQWLADEAHPEHRQAMAEMQGLWNLLEAHRPAPRYANSTHSPTRKVMVAAMCVISLGIVALSCVHAPFWTSLDWVTR